MRRWANVFLVSILGLTMVHAEAATPIDIRALPGRLYFTAANLGGAPDARYGAVRQVYELRANGSDGNTVLASTYSRASDLIWYPRLRKLGFSNISSDPSLDGWFTIDLSTHKSGEQENRIAKAIPDDFSIRFYDPKWVVIDGKSELVPGGRTHTTRVTLSPDGTQVAGLVARKDPKTLAVKNQLCIADAKGASPPVCAESSDGCAARSPVWSPDGKWLVFPGRIKEDNGQCNLFELFIVDRTGEHLRQLTDIPGQDLNREMAEAIVRPGESLKHWHKTDHPVWSPDGQWILFESMRGIGKIRPDGTRLQIVVEDGFSPTWSPDGRMIAYAVARRDRQARSLNLSFAAGPSTIFVSWADGTGATEITKNRSPLYAYKDLNWAE